MKLTIKTAELQKGDYVVGYGKVISNVWKSGFDGGIVVTFTDGSEWLTMKSWTATVIRGEQ